MLARGWFTECLGMCAGSSADTRRPDLLAAARCVRLRSGFAGGLDARKAVYAEIAGGTEGDSVTRVKLADCGTSPPCEIAPI